MGRPVLVGLVRSKGNTTYGHYAVVVGLRRDRTRVLIMDPSEGWRDEAVESFTAEWARARWVTLVVLPDGPPEASVPVSDL